MPAGRDVKVGDIVLCSVEGNWKKPTDLGVVLVVKNVKLRKNHPDGRKGEVFVHPFNKQKKPNTSLKNLKGIYI